MDSKTRRTRSSVSSRATTQARCSCALGRTRRYDLRFFAQRKQIREGGEDQVGQYQRCDADQYVSQYAREKTAGDESVSRTHEQQLKSHQRGNAGERGEHG